MVGFALIVALVVSMYVGITMISDDSRMGHTYASQRANSKVVGEISAYIFIAVFFIIFILGLINS